MKVFAIVGPRLTGYQAEAAKNMIRKDHFDGKFSNMMHIDFPEAYYGAQETRNIIDTSASLNIILTTRYEPGLSHMCQLVTDTKKIDRENFWIYLFNDDTLIPEIHQLNKDGYLEDWPMGVLW